VILRNAEPTVIRGVPGNLVTQQRGRRPSGRRTLARSVAVREIRRLSAHRGYMTRTDPGERLVCAGRPVIARKQVEHPRRRERRPCAEHAVRISVLIFLDYRDALAERRRV